MTREPGHWLDFSRNGYRMREGGGGYKEVQELLAGVVHEKYKKDEQKRTRKDRLGGE